MPEDAREPRADDLVRTHLRAEVVRTGLEVAGRVLIALIVGAVLWRYADTFGHATLDVSVAMDLTPVVTIVLGLMAGCGAAVAGAYRRKLNVLRRRLSELAEQKNRLERLIDHNRTSSGLTPEGETNPEDF